MRVGGGGRLTRWSPRYSLPRYSVQPGTELVHVAFCLSRPFMGAAIFGATNMAQLETALGAADMTLSDDVLAAIAAAHRAHPMPF